MSVKARLITLLSVILVSAFLITGIVNYRFSRESVRREIVTSSLPLTRDTIYSEIMTGLVQPLYVSSTMANDAFLRSWAESGEGDGLIILRYLSEICDKYGYSTVFFVSNRSLTYYHHDGVLKTIRPEDDHDVWFYRFVGSGLEYDLDVDTNEAADNTLTVFINFRVLDSTGETLGVTGVGLEMDIVAGLLRRTQERYQRRVYLVDSTGLIQAHANQSFIEKVSIRDLPGLGQVTGSVLGHRETSLDLSYSGEHGPVLLTSRYLPELDWFLLVEQDESTALTATRRNLIRTLLIGLVASLVVVAAGAMTVEYFQDRLQLSAVTDELTGAHNRHAFEQQFMRSQARLTRHDQPFSLILLDLDRFKRVNDTWGHLAGDRALKTLADIVRRQIRPTDVLSRWGGDEFAILVECGIESALEVANRIRMLAARELAETSTTVSAGIAEQQTGGSLDDLIRRADEALYRAKGAGRDMAVCAAPVL